jgi:hypothetical protein
MIDLIEHPDHALIIINIIDREIIRNNEIYLLGILLNYFLAAESIISIRFGKNFSIQAS